MGGKMTEAELYALGKVIHEVFMGTILILVAYQFCQFLRGK